MTSYTYDVLDNLLSVNQGSALLSRTFAYDSLSRMTSSAIPETTTAADNTPRATTFSYTAGAALCSGDPSNPCSATDPRGVTTTLSYDAVNRVTQKQYSDGTPTASFFYDEATSGGNTLSNTKGRLSHYQAAAGQSVSYFSYDSMGRVKDNWQCIPTPPNSCTSFLIDYTYDYLGNLLSRTDTDAALLHTYSAYTYTYDSAAQLSQIQMTVNAATNNILSAISYNPLGQATAATLGPTGSSMSLTRAYNNRGQLTYMQNGSVYSIGSSGNPIQYHPDGNVKFLPDSVNGSWTYAFDDFNRLVSAAKSGGATYTFDYDRFGNRWHENMNGSAQSSLTFDNKNHITNSGFAYDAAGSGNMNNDSFNTLTWDGENRLLQANNGSAVSSYSYDAIGWRVQKTTGSGSVQYLFDIGGNVIAEMTGSTLNRAEIYLGGAHLGTYTGGNTYFSHTDLLGTERARTLSTAPGATTQTCTNLPFGDGQSCPGTESSPLHFTGLQRDTETGLDQTWFRKYSSPQGRWLVPDPFGGSAQVGDPQTLNRYVYVLNNPANLLDPLGLKWVQFCTNTGSGDVCEWDWEEDAPLPACDKADPGCGDGGKSTAGGGGRLDTKGDPSIAQCAADFGNNYSLAAGFEKVTGVSKNNFFVNALLGNDASTLSNIFTGPSSGRNSASLIAGQAATAGTKAIGNFPISSNPGKIILGVTPSGNYFGKAVQSTTLAERLASSAVGSAAGKIAAKGFAAFTVGKLFYDAGTYGVGALVCHFQKVK